MPYTEPNKRRNDPFAARKLFSYSSLQLLPGATAGGGGAALGVLYERGETRAAFFAERIVFETLAI